MCSWLGNSLKYWHQGWEASLINSLKLKANLYIGVKSWLKYLLNKVSSWAQWLSCSTLCDPAACSPPDSSITHHLIAIQKSTHFIPASLLGECQLPLRLPLGFENDISSNYLYENNIFSYLYLVFAFFFWEFLLYVLYFSYWWVPPYLPERPVLYINDNHFSHMLQRFSPKISFIFPFTYVYIESTRVFNI